MVFAVRNKGIVVGDRSAHEPAWHLAQPLYCLLFIITALSPYHLQPSRSVRIHAEPLVRELLEADNAATLLVGSANARRDQVMICHADACPS